MVLPLLPIIAGGTLFGGGGVIGSLLTKGKKGGEIHATKEYYAPTTSSVYSPTHAPQLQFAPINTYGYQGATYIIDSPGATSKKEQAMDVVSRPSQMGAWDFPTSVSQEPSHVTGGGLNLPLIAGIAVVGAVAIMFVKSKKGEKK